MCLYKAQISGEHLQDHWSSGFLSIRVEKYIRMGMTIFKLFIWGGISSYICSEIVFNSSAKEPSRKI